MSGMIAEQKETIEEVVQTLAAYRLEKKSGKTDPVGVRMITELIERVKKHFPVEE